MELIAFGLIGIFSGLVAGLVGLAGGIVVVPALTWLYGVDMLHDAIVVSWFAVVFNSISAVSKQLKVRTPEQRAKLYSSARFFLAGSVLITPLIAIIFASSKDLVSTKVVAILQLCLAIAMLIPVKTAEDGAKEAQPRNLMDALVGGIIGGVSTLIGVGGGTYTIAYFVMAGKRQFQDAIATANMNGLTVGILSILGYFGSNIISQAHAASQAIEKHQSSLPIAGAVVLLATGMLAAPVGVKLSRRLPTKMLKKILIGAIVASSTKLLIA